MTYSEENPYGNTKVKVRVPVWIAVGLWALLSTAIFTDFSQAADVALQWDAVSNQNVEIYRLYSRIGDGSYDYSAPMWQARADECTDGTVSTCKLLNLQDNTLYYFVVRAVDAAGNESGDSNEVVFDTTPLGSAVGTDAGASEPADDELPGSDDSGSSETTGGSSASSDDGSGEIQADDSGSDGVSQEEISEIFPEIPVDGNMPPEVPTNDEVDGGFHNPYNPGISHPTDNSVDVELEVELGTGDFDDPDPNDFHASTRWLIYRDTDTESICVFDRISSRNLLDIVIPPLLLDSQTEYYWSAIHYDQTGMPSTPVSSSYFTTASWVADSGNPNGISDGYEIISDTDLDHNGESDNSQSDIKCFLSIFGDQNICIKVTTGCQSVQQLMAAQPVDPVTLSPPAGVQPIMPFGLVNFKIQLAAETEAAYVTTYFSDAIDGDLYWLIYDPVWGYADYSLDSSISQNRKAVTMYIEDGGAGDMDGVRNGFIVTLAGYGTTAVSDSDTDFDGSESSGMTGQGAFISDWQWESENNNCFINSLF